MTKKEICALSASIILIVCILGIMLVQKAECGADNKNYVRNIFWFECI